MADNSGDLSLGYMMGQSEGNNGGGFGNGWGDAIWIIVLLALFGGFGGRGFGGGGFGGGGCGCGSSCATQADLAAGFNNSAVLSSLNDLKLGQAGVQQTLCQGFNGVNTTVLQGFNGVDNAICTLGYQNQAGFNALGSQIASCCCDTQRAIDGVNYNMATQFCGLNNTIQNTTRDIIDSQNAGTRAILDFLVQEKLSAKDARIASLEGQLGRAEQNGVIRAAIDASTAEIIRRTGNDCPVPSYLVQPPTPVNFPVNGCGTVQFGGYGGFGNNCGCGCGCS